MYNVDHETVLAERFPDGDAPMVVAPLVPRATQTPREFECAHCAYVGSTKCALKRHEREVHGINLVWHLCQERKADGTPCGYKGKSADDVRQHMRKFHNIGVRWHVCGQPGCAYKAKTSNDLKKHKANRHDIDVVYYYCQVPGCTFVCKQRNSLNQHGRWMHSGRTPKPANVARNQVPEPMTTAWLEAVREPAAEALATLACAECVPCE